MTRTRQTLYSSRRRRIEEEEELPIDIIEEILTRLPAKHVLRCKVLSKTCYDLITKPSFINKHITNRSSRSSIVLVDNGKPTRMISLLTESLVFFPPRTPSNGRSVIVGSCNGLLVLQVFEDAEHLMLVNPATRAYVLLPRPKLEHICGKTYYADALGFGYDARSGDYKMVRIGDYSGESNHGPSSYLTEMWSMSTNTWKQISLAMPNLLRKKEYVLAPHYGLLVRGSLHWLAHAKKASEWDAFILTFNPCDDTFSQIALPKNIVDRRGKYDLVVIDFMGSLALSIAFPFGDDDSQTLFDIWVMESDSSWTKRFSIGPFPRHAKTTRVCINGKFLLKRFSRSQDTCREGFKFILYDPKTKKQQELPADEIESLGTAWSFTESLVQIPAESNE